VPLVMSTKRMRRDLGYVGHVPSIICTVLLLFVCSPAADGQPAGELMAARNSTHRVVYYTVSRANSWGFSSVA
jgi:hypothetical protein